VTRCVNGSVPNVLRSMHTHRFGRNSFHIDRVQYDDGQRVAAAQVLDVVAAYRQECAGDALFAAAVPKSYDKAVADLVEEIYADDVAAVCPCTGLVAVAPTKPSILCTQRLKPVLLCVPRIATRLTLAAALQRSLHAPTKCSQVGQYDVFANI
jgi:hypothetical protein